MTSIRGRLVLLLLSGLILVLAGGGVAVYWIAATGLGTQLDAALAVRAEALAALVTSDEGRIEFEFDNSSRDPVAEGTFEFRTPSGSVLRRSADLAGATLAVQASLDGEVTCEDVELPDGRPGRAAALAFRPRIDRPEPGELEEDEAEDSHTEDPDEDEEDDEPAATLAAGAGDILIVATAVDRGPLDHSLATLLGALLAAGTVAAASALVLVTIGVRWGLDPLSRLSRQLSTVSARTISRPLDGTGAPRELAPVYRELNQMLGRVEQTLERERSFADAAAHELRTPLCELRATAEVALKWFDPERGAASLSEVLAIGREMERLVEALLLISRANGEVAEAPADVPLAPLVQRCLGRARGAIEEKRLQVAVDLDGADALPASPAALEILVRNLIDNAVRYTPPGGSVTTRAERAGGAHVLVVENGPVLLSERDLPRLFEPFWRLDGAHSDREHVGLGLTVVHRLAEAMGLRAAAHLAGDRLQMRLAACENGPTPIPA